MTVLRSIEAKIEALFEGVFGRAFRANVQPVELARKLGKEMDDHRSISVSRVYVPNEYTIYLSPSDRAQFEGYEHKLCGELEEYLVEHANRERYALLSPPKVLFETDDDLDMGQFGIATRMVQPDPSAVPDSPPNEPAPGMTQIYSSGPPTAPAAALDLDSLDTRSFLVNGGDRRELTTERAVIGRSRECEVQIADPNVSRQHAELRREGGSYVIVDLGSTNGIEVNGRRVKRAALEPGDRISIGQTELVFEREQA
ncbi:MAG: hypothetical protein QOE29_1177 [Gaiellaceae bacterium]|jgi:hypothetical protein|nr:hypothetical protein [Gaiellaceae bacterium]